MSLSTPKTIFGVHSLTLYNRTDYLPYGMLKILGSLNFDFTGEQIDLYGGSQRFPIDSEAGVLNATLTGRIKQVENFALERFLGASATHNSADASGNVSTLTNKKGTSVVNASTGIDSVEVISGSEADLKTGFYVFKCTGAATGKVYAMSDYDFAKGTDKEFSDDNLAIVSADVTIVSGDDTPVTGFGFQFVGGSGTIGMTTGDTAYFEVRKVNTGGSDIIAVGSSTQEFAEFGAFIASQTKANGDTFEGQLYRCKGVGFPISLAEKAWLETDVSIKVLYDSTANAVARFRRVLG